MSDATAKREERRKFQAIRGTRDLLPPETALWNRVEQTAHEVFSTFGFGEIRLPIFEPTELFARAVGGETDIVSKEMYTFEDHGFVELEQVRAALIITKTFDIKDVSSFSAFERNVLNYVSTLRERFNSAEVPKTPENERVLDSILNLFERMNHFLKKYLETPADSHADMFDQYLLDVKHALRSFHFGDVLSLRPEATASVCRAYIEHNMQQLPQPVKLYYMGPMFRRERPQKGRYRQFYQIGAEILGGSDAPAIDAEVIEMLMTYFDKVGLHGATLYINSIGHNAENCRRGYVANLKAALEKVKDKLCPDSQRRIDTNPLRVLDSKLESEQPIIATLPHIADHLCDECKTNYAEVKRQLEVRGVLYQENWRLVRGLDYYMRTTFEITAPGLGSQNAVCGGGRYDGLVELLGGPPTKGIGFAIGEDRLILSLQESGKAKVEQGRDVYIAWMGEHAYAAAIRAAKDLRNAGFSVELPPLEQKFGKALGQADKLGAKYALILGDNEVSEALWTIKTLSTGEQQKLPEPELLQFLRDQKPESQ
ncbi:MAG: histidyl-tRNA synthetase [Candidatus Acidoferrum typicum]|nr:histidyl-tRNA synthetase [Candidatus Acidoferrum typicum]